MKRNKKELDVDFIGGHDTFTEADILRISAIIKADKKKKKQASAKSSLHKKRNTVSS